jgi:hypothetical protein
MSQIESTYKARDVEESIDLYFYRPLGYWVARGCRFLGLTPNTVTILSIIIGIAAGHLMLYRDVMLNVWAFVVWIISDILDSADGQLARMIDHKSKLGRILDGFGGNLIFLSMYLHLIARMALTYNVWWFWVFCFVLAAGISHSIQSALADYYRNAYLRFVVDPKRSELEGADEVRNEYRSVSYIRQPLRKFLLRIYLNYTIEQEALSKNFQLLRRRVEADFGFQIPSWFSEEYRLTNKPLMKYYAILTTNTRMIVMFFAVVFDIVPLYFITEIVAINSVMIYVTRRQERLSARLVTFIDQHEEVTA